MVGKGVQVEAVRAAELGAPVLPVVMAVAGVAMAMSGREVASPAPGPRAAVLAAASAPEGRMAAADEAVQVWLMLVAVAVAAGLQEEEEEAVWRLSPE